GLGRQGGGENGRQAGEQQTREQQARREQGREEARGGDFFAAAAEREDGREEGRVTASPVWVILEPGEHDDAANLAIGMAADFIGWGQRPGRQAAAVFGSDDRGATPDG